MAMGECPQGDAFGVFVDPVFIFCHDAMYSPCGNWQKDTKAMEESGFMSTTDQKVVASYNLNNSFWFSEGKPIVAGKVISAFATAEKWQGVGGMIGHCEEIENFYDTDGDCVYQAIGDKLPGGGSWLNSPLGCWNTPRVGSKRCISTWIRN